MIHLYFNIIGTVSFMILFYGVNAFVHFEFLQTAARPYGIAVVHSIFNIFATCLLLPFSNGLVKLAYLTIREDPSENKKSRYIDEDIKTLDIRFISNPAVAMEQCRKVIFHMADTVKDSFLKAITMLNKYDEELAKEVEQMEDDTDRYEDVLGTYMLRLTGREMSERDSQSLTLFLHSIADFERISDHAVSIVKSCEEMRDKKKEFSNKAQEELGIFTKAICRMLEVSFQVFQEEKPELTYEVEALLAVINDLSAEVRKRHIKRLRKGKCTVEMGFLLTDIVTSYERVAAHCAHIAVSMVQVRDDSLEMHGYNEEIRENNTEEFHKMYESFMKEYELP